MSHIPPTNAQMLALPADQLIARICDESEKIGYYFDKTDTQAPYREFRSLLIERLETVHREAVDTLRASLRHLNAELEKARADRWAVLRQMADQLVEARSILSWMASHDTPESRNAVTLHIDMAGKAAEFMRKHP